MEFYISEHAVLRWLHVLAMTYWLGGEWGVFNSSRYVTDMKLTLEERRRHMETAFRIDILARLGIILLLPLGLHMGFNLGTQPLGGPWIVGMWILYAFWIALAVAAFFTHKSDLGIRLTKIDESLRYIVIPILLYAGIKSFFTDEPFPAAWYAFKVTLYAILLIIGLVLRVVMRNWVTAFRSLDTGTAGSVVEAKLKREMSLARLLAYFYWIGIATVALFGVAKPIY